MSGSLSGQPEPVFHATSLSHTKRTSVDPTPNNTQEPKRPFRHSVSRGALHYFLLVFRLTTMPLIHTSLLGSGKAKMLLQHYALHELKSQTSGFMFVSHPCICVSLGLPTSQQSLIPYSAVVKSPRRQGPIKPTLAPSGRGPTIIIPDKSMGMSMRFMCSAIFQYSTFPSHFFRLKVNRV